MPRIKDYEFQPKSNCCIEGWGAAIAAAAVVGGVASSEISASGAKSAAQTQANAANSASATEMAMFNQTQQNLAPYMTSGTNALAALDKGLGIGPGAGTPGYGSLTTPYTAAQYQQSPGYAWQMQQGLGAVQNSASAAGGIGGGNTLKALQTYGTGLANSDYSQWVQQYMAQQNQQYGMLSNAANSGQNAAANLGGIATSVGSQIGSNQIGAGNALAAGTLGAAGAYAGGVNSLAQISALYGSGSMANPNSGYTSPGSYSYVAGTPYGSGGNTGVYCDRRMKEITALRGVDSESGLPVYEFSYTEDPSATRFEGYVAQDVLAKYPEAVSTGPKGFLAIDVSKVPSAKSYPRKARRNHLIDILKEAA